MNKILKIGLLLILFISISSVNAQQFKDPNKRDVRGLSKLNALNIKTMPAFFWDAVVFEIEYPITHSVSLGVNVLRKFGRTDGTSNRVFKIRPENFQNPNTSIEFAVKFYLPMSKDIGHNAPIGLYIQGNGSYNSLLFYDGTNRPFTMHSHWKKNKGLREPNPYDPPGNLSIGFGVGYQAIVIPGHIIANFMFGTQAYITQNNNTLKPGFYLAPSIGYVF